MSLSIVSQLSYEQDEEDQEDPSNPIIEHIPTNKNEINVYFAIKKIYRQFNIAVQSFPKKSIKQFNYEQAVEGFQNAVVPYLNMCWAIYNPTGKPQVIVVMREIGSNEIKPLEIMSPTEWKKRVRLLTVPLSKPFYSKTTKTVEYLIDHRPLCDMWFNSRHRIEVEKLYFNPTEEYYDKRINQQLGFVKIFPDVNDISEFITQTQKISLNTFNGFPFPFTSLQLTYQSLIPRYSNVNDAQILYDNNKLIQHINNIICDGNKVFQDYFYDWLSIIFQTKRKTKVALILKGPQGVGKSNVGNLINKMMGMRYFGRIHDISRLEQFQNDIKEKLIMWGDETKIEKYNTMETLKRYITEDNLNYQEKYNRTLTQSNNHTNFIFAVNSEKNIPIQPNERRFCVFDIKKKIPEHEYVEYFRELNDSDLEVFAMYLYTRNISNFNPERYPVSELLEKMLMNGMNEVSLFWLEVLRKGNIRVSLTHKSEKKNYDIYYDWNKYDDDEYKWVVKSFLTESYSQFTQKPIKDNGAQFFLSSSELGFISKEETDRIQGERRVKLNSLEKLRTLFNYTYSSNGRINWFEKYNPEQLESSTLHHHEWKEIKDICENGEEIRIEEEEEIKEIKDEDYDSDGFLIDSQIRQSLSPQRANNANELFMEAFRRGLSMGK